MRNAPQLMASSIRTTRDLVHHEYLLVEAGITGILNFAPIVLQVPEEVMVNNVNLAIELENLSYFIQD